jgi:hypothetical protein
LSSESVVHFKWRHNGKALHNNGKRIIISDHRNASELHIKNVSVSDEGKYQCLILDGITGGGEAAFVTVSDTAHIRVIGMCYVHFWLVSDHLSYH